MVKPLSTQKKNSPNSPPPSSPSSPSSSSSPSPSPFPSASASGKKLKGVRMRSWGKWVSEIRLPNSRARLWLGSYTTAEAAAKAYDVALICLRGPNASLNFPNSPPRFDSTAPPSSLSPQQIQALAAAIAEEASSSVITPSSPSPSAVELPPNREQQGEEEPSNSESSDGIPVANLDSDSNLWERLMADMDITHHYDDLFGLGDYHSTSYIPASMEDEDHTLYAEPYLWS